MERVTTDLAVPEDDIVAQAQSVIDAVENAISCATGADEVTEIRARIEAAKAWAKVHRRAKALRCDLLRLEVEALVRMVELHATNLLTTAEAKAAEWWAAHTQSQRVQIVADSASITTAVGLARHLQSDEDECQAGRDFAGSPRLAEGDSNVTLIAESVSDVMEQLVTEYADSDETFTVNDIADDLLVAIAAPVDERFREGVRELCRKALRRSSGGTFDGTIIPRTVTIRVDETQWTRVPTENATVAHLDEALAYREEQLRIDADKLARFREFVERVKAVPGASRSSRVGDLIRRSLAGRRKGSAAA